MNNSLPTQATFSFDINDIQDAIAIHGREQALESAVGAFRSHLEQCLAYSQLNHTVTETNDQEPLEILRK